MKQKSQQKTQNDAPKPKKVNDSVYNIPEWAYYALFAVFTFIYFFPQLTGGAYFWEDFTEYVYPVQTFAARETVEQGIPFWNPYTFGGMPFIADVQVGYFYLPNRLLSLFVGSDGYLSVWWLQFIIILHFLVAQIAMFRLARYLTISKPAAAVSAVTWAFAMIITSHTFHPMIIYHLAWFPLVFMFFKKALDKESPANAIYAGLILGGTLLSGHPQTTLYEFLFLVLFFIWHFISMMMEKKSEDVTFGRYVMAGVLPFVIAAGIFMIQYLPSSELAEVSQRAEMTYEKSAEGSLEFKQILTGFVPKLYGYINGNNDTDIQFHLTSGAEQVNYYYYWETAFYFGVVGLSLGLIGLFWQNDRKFKWFLVSILMFGLAYALGSNFFLHKLINNFPLFDQFRIPARMMFYLVFAFSILAGFGIDFMVKESGGNVKKYFSIAAIPAIILLLAAIGIMQGIVGTPEQFSSAISATVLLPLILIAIALVIMWQLMKGKINVEVAGLAIAVIVLIDLTVAGASLNQSNQNPKDAFTLAPELKSMLKPKQGEYFRVNTRMYEPRSIMAMKRNQGMVDKIPLVEGYNPLVLQEVFPPVGTTEAAFDLMNIKYFIDFDVRTNQPYFALNDDMMPRVWVVHSNALLNPADVASEMKRAKFDFNKEVVMTESIPFKLSHTFDGEGKASISQYENNYIKANISSPENGIVVFSEVYFPAWKAYVNGQQSDLYKVNGNMRAVAVEKGESIVELKYQSERFSSGMWITIVTLLASVGGIFYYRRKEKA